MSPSLTLSPTFLNHFATVPSSIVSLNLGILIISTSSGITVLESSSETIFVVSEILSLSSFSVESPLIILEISSPFFPIIAKRVSTGAVPPS